MTNTPSKYRGPGHAHLITRRIPALVAGAAMEPFVARRSALRQHPQAPAHFLERLEAGLAFVQPDWFHHPVIECRAFVRCLEADPNVLGRIPGNFRDENFDADLCKSILSVYADHPGDTMFIDSVEMTPRACIHPRSSGPPDDTLGARQQTETATRAWPQREDIFRALRDFIDLHVMSRLSPADGDWTGAILGDEILDWNPPHARLSVAFPKLAAVASNVERDPRLLGSLTQARYMTLDQVDVPATLADFGRCVGTKWRAKQSWNEGPAALDRGRAVAEALPHGEFRSGVVEALS